MNNWSKHKTLILKISNLLGVRLDLKVHELDSQWVSPPQYFVSNQTKLNRWYLEDWYNILSPPLKIWPFCKYQRRKKRSLWVIHVGEIENTIILLGQFKTNLTSQNSACYIFNPDPLLSMEQQYLYRVEKDKIGWGVKENF